MNLLKFDAIPENPLLKVFKEIKRLKQQTADLTHELKNQKQAYKNKIAVLEKENKEYTKLYRTMDNEIKNKEEEMQNEIHDNDKIYNKLVDQYSNLKDEKNELQCERNYRDHAHGQLRRNAQIESQRDLEQQNVKLMVANGDRKYLQNKNLKYKNQIGDLNQEIVNMERTSGLGPFVDYKINYGDKDGLSNNIFIGENTLLEEKYAQLREKYDVMKTKIDDESDAKSTLGSTTNSTTSGDDHLKNDVAIDTKPSKVNYKRTQKDDEQIKELIEGLNKSQPDLHKIENNINTQQDEQIKRLQKQDKTIKDLTNDLTAQNIYFVKDFAKQYVTTTEQNIEHKNQMYKLNKELDWQELRNEENYKKIEHLTNKKPINKKKSKMNLLKTVKNVLTGSKNNKESKKNFKITKKNLTKPKVLTKNEIKKLDNLYKRDDYLSTESTGSDSSKSNGQNN
jgi:hypothetical protein